MSVVWQRVTTRVGALALAATESGVCFASLGSAERAQERLRAWVAEHEGGAALVRGESAPLVDALERVRAYAEGRESRFDELRLDLRGTPFQLAVWSALRAIPLGETRTYGELARALGRPGAARAVGRANGANPVPLIVPCHRVVAQAGLGGFTGGIEHKVRLLEHEGALRPRLPFPS